MLVHVNIGQWTRTWISRRTYEVPLEKGVPALAVLSENGKLLYSQQAAAVRSDAADGVVGCDQFLVQVEADKPGLLSGDGDLLVEASVDRMK